MTYQPFQQRVVDEQKALSEKINALAAFIDGETFDSLPEAEKERLEHQLSVMREYSQILKERIEAFTA